MEINFKWIWEAGSLGSLPEVDGKKDYVVVVNWRYRGTCADPRDVNQDIMVDQYGQSTFKVEEDQKDYIPYEELTEEIIVGWLNLDVNAMEESLTKQVEAILNPPIVYPPIPFTSSSKN